MAKKKRSPDEFRFVGEHIKGDTLLKGGFLTDDDGQPILPHRLYAYQTNRKAHRIYLNPKEKK